jgi:hypothetical protein
MNTELLLRVKAAILEEPNKFDMGMWFEDAACGTTACIAGWSVALSENLKDLRDGFSFWGKLDGTISGHAAKAIGVDELTADKLFYTNNWPEDLERLFNNAHSTEERAKVAADRIDHFISTEGRE